MQIINENYSLERFTDLVENESENLLEEDEEIELTAIQFKHFTNENQIIKELDTARLVIDLSENLTYILKLQALVLVCLKLI